MVAENHFPIGQQSASKPSNGGIDVLANPALNIPSEQTLMELEATLKGLVANSAIASQSRLVFMGCACLFLGLAWSFLVALGVPTLLGATLGTWASVIMICVSYLYLRRTQLPILTGLYLRQTSVLRNLAFPHWMGTERPSQSSDFLGLSILQLVQIACWMVLWTVSVAVATHGAPQFTDSALPFLLLLGLISYLAVRVATAMCLLARASGAVIGGVILGSIAAAAICIWSYRATTDGGTLPLLLPLAALILISSFSFIRSTEVTTGFVTIRPSNQKGHLQTPYLQDISRYFTPVQLRISSGESTVVVLQRAPDGNYLFHDLSEPIYPIDTVYDIFDLAKSQVIAVSFNLSAGVDAHPFKVAVQYDCHPRTARPEEMNICLDAGAVTRFTEVFFHGLGLSASLSDAASPWLKAAVQQWMDTSPVSQEFANVRKRLHQIINVADNLTFDPTAKDIRLENLPSGFRDFSSSEATTREAAHSHMELLRGDMAAAEKLNAAIGNSLNDLQDQISKFRVGVHQSVPIMQQFFDAEINKAFEGVHQSYKILVSLLSLRISSFDVSLDDIEAECKECRKLWSARFNEVKSKFEQTLLEQKRLEDQVFISALSNDVDEQQIAGAKLARAEFAATQAHKSLGQATTVVEVKIGVQALGDLMMELNKEANAIKNFYQAKPQPVAVSFVRNDQLPMEKCKIVRKPVGFKFGDSTTGVFGISVELSLQLLGCICAMLRNQLGANVALEDQASGLRVVMTSDGNLAMLINIRENAPAPGEKFFVEGNDQPPQF